MWFIERFARPTTQSVDRTPSRAVPAGVGFGSSRRGDWSTASITKSIATGVMWARGPPRRRSTRLVRPSARESKVCNGELHLGEDSRPYALTGRPLGDLLERDPGVQPRVMEQDAPVAIRQHLSLPDQVRIAIRPIVFPLEGKGVWAFEGRCVLYDSLANIRAYVRAGDLSLMLSFDMAAASFQGEAHVFSVNPLRTPDLEVVRLDQIGPLPSDRLYGSSIQVSPWQGAPLTHQSRDYRLNPTDDGFDESHLFYHLQQAMRYFEAIVDPSVLQKPRLRRSRPTRVSRGFPKRPYIYQTRASCFLGR